MKIYQLKCNECGAPLNRDGKCEYCGAQYKLENEILVQTIQAPVKTLACMTTFHNDGFMDEKVQVERSMDIIREQIAEGLLGMVKYQTEYNPIDNITMIRGTVRVVEPNFCF